MRDLTSLILATVIKRSVLSCNGEIAAIRTEDKYIDLLSNSERQQRFPASGVVDTN